MRWVPRLLFINALTVFYAHTSLAKPCGEGLPLKNFKVNMDYEHVFDRQPAILENGAIIRVFVDKETDSISIPVYDRFSIDKKGNRVTHEAYCVQIPLSYKPPFIPVRFGDVFYCPNRRHRLAKPASDLWY